MRVSLDIPCSLCPVVAMLELTGTCVTVALPTVTVISSFNGNLILAENSCGASLKVLTFLPGGVG